MLGCAGSYDGPAPSGDGAAAYGKVLDLLGGGLGDVTVCPLDTPDACVVSEGDGDFLVEGLPEDTDVVVTMDKPDHLRTAYLHHTTVTQEWRKTLMPDSLVSTMANRVDIEREPGKGHLMFILWEGPDYASFNRVEGVEFSIDAPDATVFYQAGGGLPDPTLTATSSAGSGGAFNLEPGEYQAWFTAPGKVCEPWFSFDFPAGGAVPVRIVADYASYVDLVCR